MISILLPTDFSAISKNAIFYLMSFFKDQHLKVYVLNTYQPLNDIDETSVSRSVYNEIVDSLKNASLKNLNNFVADIKATTSSKHSFQVVSAQGPLVEAVNDFSEQKNIDLIVMGTAGKSNLSSARFGSHTFHVLKSVKCPVLVVPSTYRKNCPQQVLFSTDYKIAYQPREVNLLEHITHSHQSEITVLYVSKQKNLTEKQHQMQTTIKQAFPASKIKFCTENSTDVAGGIQNYMNANKSELLVMVNTHHRFWDHLLFESMIDNVAHELKIPMLVLQNRIRANELI